MKLKSGLLLLCVSAIVGVTGCGAASGNDAGGPLHASGMIEATEVHLPSKLGGTVTKTYVNRGDVVQAGQKLLSVYSSTSPGSAGMNEAITSPINGVVLERTIQAGESASAGAPLVVVADLNTLTLTVYVPENRYGQISVGHSYPVTVDSFPGEAFTARVSHIASQAEFTPRNVQTVEGRQTTVFAVTLDLDPSSGRLKPGMPADVTFFQND
jgi:multidrug resistance efflux pump